MLGVGKNTVEIIIAARDRTQAAFAKVNTQMKTMGGTTGRLKSSMGSLTGKMSALATSINPVMIAAGAAAIALATMGGAAIKASLEFEKAVATIRVGTGATGEALAGLEGSFKTVFTAVPTTTAAAATAIADLNTRLGLTGKPLEALATQFLNLARITGTDVAASISSATRVMHDFDVSTKDQATALDYLFKVSQSTGLGMTQLGNSMTQYGSVMRQMGFDIKESAALLGKFEKEGVNLELVLGSLRQGLAKFSKAGEEPVEALQRVTAAIAGTGSVADANALAMEVFGARAGPDMAAAIREGRFSIAELMASLDASSETINKAAEDALTFGDTWTLFKNKIMTAIEPIGDVILNVLGGAMNTAMAAFDLAKINIDKFKAALSPLTTLIGDLYKKISGGHSIIQNLKDTVTVLWAGLKLLGDVIIWLIKHAIILFVNHIKETIKVLTAFYNKLGPLKDLIEFVKGAVDKGVEGFHNYAESFREVEKEADNLMDRLDAVIVDLEGVTNKVAEIPKVIVKEWVKAVDAFEEGTGSYKDAIGAIDTEIERLTALWKRAGDEEKELYEEWIRDQIELKEAMIEEDRISTETLNRNIGLTKEAIEKTKEFKVTIGDTTIEFKGMAAEVLKNADAYEKLQKAAKTFTELDWAVFSEFEAALPNINAGIGDMEASFVGFKDILEDNIDKLENIKQSVMDISEIAAPFLEAGFLNGIKAIGNFAGALKDASSAIHAFSSLQEVSIEGCINFSLHVRDMVSALEILERQMEDLVPVFGDFDSLITNILETFVWIPGKKETLADEINRIAYAAKDGSGTIGNLWTILEETTKLTESGWKGEFALPFIERYKKGAEDIEDITADFLASGEVLERQFGYTTEALAFQTGQLNKITEALQPYLEFMRTLNELAALSTLSTEELNNGLNSIKDTLINLGTALSDFDLRPVMESLFGTKITEGDLEGKFTGGLATPFMDVIKAFEGPFNDLIVYISRLSFAISSLVNSFEALTNISESVLADQTKLKEIFEDITDIMTNFSTLMGGTEGFAQKFADGMDSMLTSAGPLITYFQENNAAVIQFNNTLGMFKTTITHVVDTMAMLKKMSEMTVPSVDELGACFDRAKDFVDVFDKALMEHIGLIRGEEYNIYNLEKLYDNLFTSIMQFADDWARIDKIMGDSFDVFADGIETITKLINSILSLASVFESLKDLVVPSVTEIEAGFVKIRDGIAAVEEALDSPVWGEVSTNLGTFKVKWDAISEGLKDSIESFFEVITLFSNIVSAAKQLTDTFTDMGDIVVITVDQIKEAFKDIPEVIGEVTKYLATESFMVIEDALKVNNTEWKLHKKVIDDTLPSFNEAIDTISTLVSKVLSLSSSLIELRDMTVLSVRDIDEALKNIPVFLDHFVDALRLNMYAIKQSLKDLHIEWAKHADEMMAVMPAYEASTASIGKLIGSLLSLMSALKSLSEMGTISSATFDKGFSSLIKSISNFAVSLSNNVDDLIFSLQKLRTVWIENEAVLFPLIRDFAIITDNLWGVAHNANRMAEEFSNLNKNAGTLERGFKSLIEFINQVVESTEEFYTPEAAAELAGFIEDVEKVIKSFVDLEIELNGAMNKIKSAIGTAVDTIEGKIKSIDTLTVYMYNSGVNLMQSLINGIAASMPALQTQMDAVTDIIEGNLGVESPTRLGPLRNLEEWPRNLIQSYSTGLEQEMHTLNRSFASFAPSMGVASAGGGNRSVTIHNTQYISSREDAEYATRDLERMLQRHEVM